MPKVTPGFHQCPRCLNQDIYFAKRSTGTVGNIIDLPQGVANPKMGLDIEKEVAICRDCGERANWIPEKREYSEKEKEYSYRKSQRIQAKIAFWVGVVAGSALLYIGNNSRGTDDSILYVTSFFMFTLSAWALLRGKKFK
jgi:hypothetical protein